MKRRAGCALFLLVPALLLAETREDHRTRLEFQFLCDYKPENGLTKFTSSICGNPVAIAAATPAELRKEMDSHWGHQPEMRYAELTIVNYQTAFNRAHPPEKDPLPTADQLPKLQMEELCSWWRTRKFEAGVGELLRRKELTRSEADLIRRNAVQIGMSEKAMLCSLGTPRRRNRTALAGKMSIQYVFERGNVYTENGVVTAWQD